MKRFVKALIVAGILIGSGVLCGVLGNILIVAGVEKPQETEYEEKYYATSPDKMDEIELDLATETVYIVPAEGDEIEIQYWDKTENPEFRITEHNGKLIISKNPKMQIGFQMSFFWNEPERHDEMTIGIPEDYVGSYNLGFSSGAMNVSDLVIEEKLTIDGTSGIVNLENIECKKEVMAEMSSGQMTLAGVSISEDVQIGLTSGVVKMSDVTIDKNMSLDMSSGSIEATNVEVAENLTMDMTSGSIKMDTLTVGYVSLEASSGDCKILALTTEKGIYLDATSGDFEVSLTDEMENYNISTDITSGDCNLSNNYGDGEKTIFVGLTSGDADFNFEKAE
ncbi:MAG: DUF4097 family beta strand repeat protein [Lachnospiraceae bacterium]|nr:DUF4097 family beta strand repeat protein [Lachnospiraceae bacterium]